MRLTIQFLTEKMIMLQINWHIFIELNIWKYLHRAWKLLVDPFLQIKIRCLGLVIRQEYLRAMWPSLNSNFLKVKYGNFFM